MSNATPNRIQNAGFVTNTTAASAPSLTTPSLNTAYLNQVVDVGGTKYFVDAYGVATKFDTSTTVTTTSLTPIVRSGSSDVNAQANTTTTLCDVLRLSDSTYINTGKVSWVGHGLTVGSWYYTSQTTAGAYVTPAPTSGLIQQLFFVLDANTILVNIEPGESAAAATTSLLDALTTSQPVPTATGNTTNKNTIFKATDGVAYFVDSTGDSVQLGGTATKAILRAQYTTNVSIAHNSYMSGFTLVALNTVPAAWNNSTGTFTAQTTGFYMVSIALAAYAPFVVGGFLEVILEKNGNIERSVLDQSGGVGTFHLCTSGTFPVYLTAGDTLRFKVYSSNTTLSHINSTHIGIVQL